MIRFGLDALPEPSCRCLCVLTAAIDPRDRASGRPGRCGVWSWRESSNPEIPHEPSFRVPGLACGGRAGLVARVPAQEEAAKPTQIVLRPAAAPVPALKYQLLPERRTLVPGNAAIFYHRAIELMLEQYASREQRASKPKATSARRREVGRRLAERPALVDSPRAGEALLEAQPQLASRGRAGCPASDLRLGVRATRRVAFTC